MSQNLQGIESFIAIVDHGSISAAAKHLALTPAALSKRLQLLERHLGTRLLTRNTRQLALTEAGDYYFHHSRTLLDEMRRIDKHVQDMQGVLKGNLRLNLPMTYGKFRLMPWITRFLVQHPDIQISCRFDDSIIDVNRGDHDLVVRVGQLEDSSLVARKLEDIGFILVASPAYLERHGQPQIPADLKHHNCLQYTNIDPREGWLFHDASGRHLHRVQTQGALSCNNGEALKTAAIEGLGLALLPDFALDGELETGQLVALLEDYQRPGFSSYAVYPSRRYLPEKTRALIKYLVENLGPVKLHAPE